MVDSRPLCHQHCLRLHRHLHRHHRTRPDLPLARGGRDAAVFRLQNPRVRERPYLRPTTPTIRRIK